MSVKTAAVYAHKSNGRTKHIAAALREGFRRHGIRCSIITSGSGIVADIAAGYGWNHAQVFARYRKQKLPYLFFDLGYWDRRPSKQPREGYHRVAVNSWDSDDSMLPGQSADRFNKLNIRTKPWKDPTEPAGVLITGMSAKSAATHGYRPHEWERNALNMVKAVFKGRVDLRAKPSSKKVVCEPIEVALRRSRFLVTHHSNTAVDALVNGVPYYCVKGVARRLSEKYITSDVIDNPRYITDAERNQLLYDIAYTQWTPQEIRTGELWEYLKNANRF